MKNSTATILILISIGLFYVVTNPRYEAGKLLRHEATQYRKVLDSASALAETRDVLLADYRNIPRADLEKLTKILPDNIDTVRLAMDFDSIASQYGISIRNIQVTTQKEDADEIVVGNSRAPYEITNISFSFISTYANFRNFLQDIERSLRIIDVKSVAFRSTDTGLYEFQVAIETYWLK